MTHLQRKIIFWLLVIFFIIATPLVLLYALGYSYDWSEQRLEKTGAFFLKSKPPKAEIYINGKYKGQTNRLIKRLKPRVYEVEVRLEGFHPWTKQLSILSRQITQAPNIVLFPKNPIIEELARGVFDIEEFLKSPAETTNEQNAKKLLADLPGILTWQLCEDNIVYLQEPALGLYRTDLMTGQIREQLSFQPLPAENEKAPAENDDYKIVCSGLKKIAILTPQKTLFFLNPDQKVFEKIDQDIKGASFAPDRKKLMYWTENEIWVRWLEDELGQPSRQKTDEILITRFAQEIGQVVWYAKDNEHLIFTVGDKIKIAELDNRDFVNIIDFLEIKEPKIFYHEKRKALYFLSRNILYRTSI